MPEAREIVVQPIITEQSMELMEKENTYTFQVLKEANKIEIREAIEEIFDVVVENVNTMNVRGKNRSMGRDQGKTPDWKKALVRLAEGEEIQIYEGL